MTATVTWAYTITVHTKPLTGRALEQITAQLPGFATVTADTGAGTVTAKGVISNSPDSDLEIVMKLQAVLRALTTPPFGADSLRWKEVEVTRVA